MGVDSFIGTVVCVGFNYAPQGWAFCSGQLLPIAQYTALFSLLGTTYGGDGRTTFALPDLRSRAPRHRDSSGVPGTQSGVENVTLTLNQMAQHTHAVEATTAQAGATSPQGAVLAAGAPRGIAAYAAPGTIADLTEHALGETGGLSSHSNIQPYLAMNYVIATQGPYPGPPGDEEPYLGEIGVFPFGFAPRNWAECNGQVLSISSNAALFSLLGVTYGGDGRSTFALPDLQGRTPLGFGQGPGLSAYLIGQRGGSETVSLNGQQMPQHFHQLEATQGNGTSVSPGGNMMAVGAPIFNGAALDAKMDPRAVGLTGSGTGHENMMPYLTLNYCICTQGIYPPRS